MCLLPYVAIRDHFSRAYILIIASPLRNYWWVKMIHSASFWCILFISKWRTTAFSSFSPLSMFRYFFLVCLEGSMVRHNTTTMSPFPINRLSRFMLLARKKCVLADHNKITTLSCYLPLNFQGKLFTFYNYHYTTWH